MLAVPFTADQWFHLSAAEAIALCTSSVWTSRWEKDGFSPWKAPRRFFQRRCHILWGTCSNAQSCQSQLLSSRQAKSVAKNQSCQSHRWDDQTSTLSKAPSVWAYMYIIVYIDYIVSMGTFNSHEISMFICYTSSAAQGGGGCFKHRTL